eukprot:374001-Rhodomonas_salina.1
MPVTQSWPSESTLNLDRTGTELTELGPGHPSATGPLSGFLQVGGHVTRVPWWSRDTRFAEALQGRPAPGPQESRREGRSSQTGPCLACAVAAPRSLAAWPTPGRHVTPVQRFNGSGPGGTHACAQDAGDTQEI